MLLILSVYWQNTFKILNSDVRTVVQICVKYYLRTLRLSAFTLTYTLMLNLCTNVHGCALTQMLVEGRLHPGLEHVLASH